MGFSWFLTTSTGLAMVLSMVWPWIYCCVMIICEMSLVFCQIDNPRFSFITYWILRILIHVENLLDEIWKFVKLVSYVSQQRGSPWLDAFGILHSITICNLLFIRTPNVQYCCVIHTHAISPGPSLDWVRRSFAFLLLWLFLKSTTRL